MPYMVRLLVVFHFEWSSFLVRKESCEAIKSVTFLEWNCTLVCLELRFSVSWIRLVSYNVFMQYI